MADGVADRDRLHGLLIQPRWVREFLALDGPSPGSKTIDVRSRRCLLPVGTPVYLIETDTQRVSPAGRSLVRVAASAKYIGCVTYATQAEFDADFQRHRAKVGDIQDIQLTGKRGRTATEVSYPLYGWMFGDISPYADPLFIEYKNGWRGWVRFRLEWAVAAADTTKKAAARKALRAKASAKPACEDERAAAVAGNAEPAAAARRAADGTARGKRRALASAEPAGERGGVAAAAGSQEAVNIQADDNVLEAPAPASGSAAAAAPTEGPAGSASHALGLIRRVLTRLEGVRLNHRGALMAAKCQLRAAKHPDTSSVWDEVAKAMKKTSDLASDDEDRVLEWTSDDAWLNVNVTLAEDTHSVDNCCGLLRKALDILTVHEKGKKKEKMKRVRSKIRKIEDGKKKVGNLRTWQRATAMARKELGIVGFASPKKGSQFHEKAREIAKQLSES